MQVARRFVSHHVLQRCVQALPEQMRLQLGSSLHCELYFS